MSIMNPDEKAKWVAALRSGQYKQGRDALFNIEQNSFCCLGVLLVAVAQRPLNKSEHYYLHDGNEFNLSHELQVALGSSNDGRTLSTIKKTYREANFDTVPEYSPSIVGALESVRSNFNQIADWIEKNL